MIDMMKNLFTDLATLILPAFLLTGFLTACAPPPGAMQSSNLTLDMRRMQATLDKHGQLIEDLSGQVEQLQKQQLKQAETIEQFRQTRQPIQSVFPSTPQPTYTPGETATEAVEGSPTEVYLRAFGDYASGRYREAIQGFESFLQFFPNNSYASNAQFWLADSYFNQQQYPVSIEEFERVLNDYSEAAKSPEALYKIAVAYLQLGENEEARKTVDLLIQRYPNSSASQKAQELLIP